MKNTQTRNKTTGNRTMTHKNHTFSAKLRRTMLVCAVLIAGIGTVVSTFRTTGVSAACGAGCVASMRVTPASGSYNPGNTVTVSIYVNSGGQNVNAVQADLNYSASYLQFQSINPAGSAFGIDASSSGGGGSVSIARGNISAISGSSLLVAQVNFQVLAAGTATISFSGSSTVASSSTNQDILGSTTGGSYSVTSSTPPPSTPPPVQQTAPPSNPGPPTGKKPVPTATAQQNSTPQSTPETSAPTTETTTEQPKTNATAATDNSTPTATKKTNTWLMPALITGGVVVLGAGGAGAWLLIRRRRMSVVPSGIGGSMPTASFITGSGPTMPPVRPPVPPSSSPQDGFTAPVDHHDETPNDPFKS